jgi:hypothetical protein
MLSAQIIRILTNYENGFFNSFEMAIHNSFQAGNTT